MHIVVIVLFSIFLVSLIIGVTIYSVLGIKNYTPSQTSVLPAPVYSETRKNPTRHWNEPPPCFQGDVHAMNVFKLIVHENKVYETRDLLDTLSILLCLLQDCTSDRVKRVQVQFLGMGADIHDAAANERTYSFVKLSSSSQLHPILVAATYLLTKQLAAIREAKVLPKDVSKDVEGHVYQFCAAHFPTILENCNKVRA